MTSVTTESPILSVPDGFHIGPDPDTISIRQGIFTICTIGTLTVTSINGTVIVGTLVTTTSTQTLSNKTLIDNSSNIVNVLDNTKKLAFSLAAATAATTLTISAAQTANRTYTIPDSGANSNFVLTDGAQTINGAKTFTAAITITPVTNQIILGVTNTVTISSVAPTASRTYTIPDSGANSSFVLTDGAQTINGTKTFSANIDTPGITHTGSIILQSNGNISVTAQGNSGASPMGFILNRSSAVQDFVIGIAAAANQWVQGTVAQDIALQTQVNTQIIWMGIGLSQYASFGLNQSVIYAATDSSSSTTGAFLVVGGAGIAKKLYVGTNLVVGTNIDTSNITHTGGITLQSNGNVGLFVQGNSGTSAMAIVLNRSSAVQDFVIGIAANANDWVTGTVTQDIALQTQVVTQTIWMGFAATRYASFGQNQTVVYPSADSTSTSTGALITNGGVGIAKKLFVGTSANVTAATNQIVLGPAAGPNITITGPGPAASRTYTIPDSGANSSFVLTDGAQTVNGAKTFSSAVTINPVTNQIILGVTNTVTINSTAPAASRTYTIPDSGANSSFVLTDGAQTLTGIITHSNVTNTTGANTGSVQLSGGLYITKDTLHAGVDYFSTVTSNPNATTGVGAIVHLNTVSTSNNPILAAYGGTWAGTPTTYTRLAPTYLFLSTFANITTGAAGSNWAWPLTTPIWDPYGSTNTLAAGQFYWHAHDATNYELIVHASVPPQAAGFYVLAFWSSPTFGAGPPFQITGGNLLARATIAASASGGSNTLHLYWTGAATLTQTFVLSMQHSTVANVALNLNAESFMKWQAIT